MHALPSCGSASDACAVVTKRHTSHATKGSVHCTHTAQHGLRSCMSVQSAAAASAHLLQRLLRLLKATGALLLLTARQLHGGVLSLDGAHDRVGVQPRVTHGV